MSQPFIGEIRMFAGNFAPLNWAFCDGSLIPISENDTLFNLIGTTYGGDGVQNFALPNLSCRIPIHQGPGFIIGQMSGVESVTLNINQIPQHTHAPVASNVAADSTNPSASVWGLATQARPYSAAAPTGPMHPASVGPSGGSQPHDNMAPFLVVSFIISLFGIFPSQN
jgi:microcystin-dependent protein